MKNIEKRPEPCFVSAVATPLDAKERLNHDEFTRHLNEQWADDIYGVLVGGTMGAMQLLSDRTYEELVEAAAFSEPAGRMWIGAGDSSLARSKDRMALVNRYRVDGVVVLCPYVFEFSQSEIIEYFLELADFSVHPLYLYDLPLLTRTPLETDAVLRLSQHPNILGMKAAGQLSEIRELLRVVPENFHLFVAQAPRVVELLREGINHHVDGVFSLAPSWMREIDRAVRQDDWVRAAEYQARLSRLLEVILKYPVFSAFSCIMQARGFSANFAPKPFRSLTPKEREELLLDPVVVELVNLEQEKREAVISGRPSM